MCKLGFFEPEIIELLTQNDQRVEQVIRRILLPNTQYLFSCIYVYIQVYIKPEVPSKTMWREDNINAELNLGIFSS